MSNLHRIAWIDAQIRLGRFPNATGIATEFEISRRQAARDIEYMRYSLDAPLEFSAERNGYAYAEPGFRLPLQGESLPEAVRRGVPTGVRANAAETRSRIRRAIEERRKLVLHARNPGQPLSIGRVHPYRIAMLRDLVDPYLVAYCERRRAVHSFHLAFIDAVEVLPAHFHGVHPEPPEVLALRRPYRARLELPPHALPETLAPAARWLEDGSCEVEFRSSDVLLGALFGQPAPFRVLAPRWLRERLKARLAALAERNASGVGQHSSHPRCDTAGCEPDTPRAREGGLGASGGRDG